MTEPSDAGEGGGAFYYVAREPGMLAIATVIMLLVKSGTLRAPHLLDGLSFHL